MHNPQEKKIEENIVISTWCSCTVYEVYSLSLAEYLADIAGSINRNTVLCTVNS